MFASHAVISLVPVLVLGIALAAGYHSLARSRGLAEGRSEAILVAETAVEPVLSGRPLSAGLTPKERAGLSRLATRSIAENEILRFRLRDSAGKVVFSDDGSGFRTRPEDEALRAARGYTVARLTRLNTDSNDSGRAGPQAVEVYLPLKAGRPKHRVGVLEIYLPYAPINADVTTDLHNLYVDLAIGLALLYLILFAISASVSRGLRKQVRVNTFLAEHDALTKLPNRSFFHRRVTSLLSATDVSHPIAIALVDLDRFREVNDTIGHNNGDELLAQLARRLNEVTRPEDTVARIGGDEFGIILTNATDPEPAFRRIRDTIDLETLVGGLPLSVEASIGYVVSPDDGADADTLLQLADIAMYVAKARRSGVVRFEPGQNHYDPANLALIGELRQAIDSGHLLLHYQPKIRLEDWRVEAVEALVRWNHPVQGLLAPGRFLPLAEQTDIIFELTDWVLDAAVAALRSLPDDLSMAVNVSARSLARIDFARDVLGVLERYGVDGKQLIVEVTETSLLTDPACASIVLGEFARAGVRVSIDDFGSGQTSLGYLSSLHVSELKIDRSFVTDVLENQSDAAIVQSIVDLAHNLSLRVVGEGVETASVLDHLREAGCDEAQGFFVAMPMPIEDLHKWLGHHTSEDFVRRSPRGEAAHRK